MKRRIRNTTRSARRDSQSIYRATRRAFLGAEMPAAGTNDHKYFPAVSVEAQPADLIPMMISKADIITITAALLHIGKPDTLDIVNRLPSMRRKVS